jgi:hypothetical protein
LAAVFAFAFVFVFVFDDLSLGRMVVLLQVATLALEKLRPLMGKLEALMEVLGMEEVKGPLTV